MEINWETTNATWHGWSNGSGERLLLCLHGYGQDAHLFDFLLKNPPRNCTVVSLDLPGFGKSDFARPPRAADLEELTEKALAQFPETVQLDLIGFSLGAKVALSLFPHSRVPVRRVVLVSPDGLRIHPLYRFCIYNPVGRWLFKRVLRRPGGFLFVLRILHNLKVADAFKYRFVKGQFEREARRKLLKKIWLGYAHIRPDLKQVGRKTQEWNTHWDLIWGKSDAVLPFSFSRSFLKKVVPSTLHPVDGGHHLLGGKDQRAQSLIQTLLQEP